MKKNKERVDSAARKAVNAYNEESGNFDALGSYTGKGQNGMPCQDADDL